MNQMTLMRDPAIWLDIDGRLYVLRYGYVNAYQQTGVRVELGDYAATLLPGKPSRGEAGCGLTRRGGEWQG